MRVGKEWVIRAVKCSLDLRRAVAFGTLGTCGEWGWRPDTRGVSLGGDLPTHPLLLLSGYYMRRKVCDSSTSYFSPSSRLAVFAKLFLSVHLESAAVWRRDLCAWAHVAVGIFFFNLSENPAFIMPRSFLVKKYFSSKKPYYRESQMESQTGKFFTHWLI